MRTITKLFFILLSLSSTQSAAHALEGKWQIVEGVCFKTVAKYPNITPEHVPCTPDNRQVTIVINGQREFCFNQEKEHEKCYKQGWFKGWVDVDKNSANYEFYPQLEPVAIHDTVVLKTTEYNGAEALIYVEQRKSYTSEFNQTRTGKYYYLVRSKN